jgi:hypothetical protein
MPDAAADSGLSAFGTSIHAHTLSAFVSCAMSDRAGAVLPEHSAPTISVTAPTGSPPFRTALIATIPAGMISRIVFAAGVRAGDSVCQGSFDLGTDGGSETHNFRIIFAFPRVGFKYPMTRELCRLPLK